MNALLDTHVWLWMLTAPHRLAPFQDALADASNTLWLSSVSTWEIAIKSSLGRLELPEPVSTYVPSRMRSTRVTPLPVTHAHAIEVADLPPIHRDPFDRLLVAQARVEDLPLITADDVLDEYDVEVQVIG